MKLTPRGFTLVELMIVIAIIGILAAALFPSLTSYLARGRDTSRVAAIKEIVTAIAGYSLDKVELPTGTAGGAAGTANCVHSGNLSAYIVKYPVDPTSGRISNCGTAGQWGYGTGTDNGGTSTFAISAVFENSNGGNTGGTAQSYQGYAFAQGVLVAIDTFKKGSGSGYVIRN